MSSLPGHSVFVDDLLLEVLQRMVKVWDIFYNPPLNGSSAEL